MRRERRRLLVGLALISSIVGGAVLAQAPDPNGCTPQERSSQALQQDARKSSGIICPPEVDPAMKSASPKAGDDDAVHPPPPNPGDRTPTQR